MSKMVQKKRAIDEVVNQETIKDLMEQLTDQLEARCLAQSSIKREGNQIIIPGYMSYKEAANALLDHEEQMEEDTAKIIKVHGHISDMLVAFDRSMTKTFGQIVGRSEMVFSFFGAFKIPSQTMTVKTSFEDTITVPVGKIAIPGMPLTLHVQLDENKKLPMKSAMEIHVEYKKKYEYIVELIEKAIHEELKNNSIFTGKAIDSKFNFLNLHGFPLSKIVYAEDEEHDLNAHMFRMIRSTALARKNKLPIKRTILLYGKYGTGKTLTALKAANICTENAWTFMNVQPGDDITAALEFAKRYQPCLVFFEDIDQVTSGERTVEINNILNIIDGILSKSSEVMTILTTNHAARIEAAMMRPGRIDAVIELGRIDATSLNKMIEAYCGGTLSEVPDGEMLLQFADDYTPSFIAEACNRAILYAMERVNGGNPNDVRISNEDLKRALVGLRVQYDMMVGDKEKIKRPLEDSLGHIFDGVIQEKLEEFGRNFHPQYFNEKYKENAEKKAS